MTQSLLTQEEYDKYSRIYKTYNRGRRKHLVEGDPHNIHMGDALTPEEVTHINRLLDEALKRVIR